MKVFRVIAEYVKDGSDEIIQEQQYVTHVDNTILAVTKHMAAECGELGKDMKSVDEVLVVSYQIGK